MQVAADSYFEGNNSGRTYAYIKHGGLQVTGTLALSRISTQAPANFVYTVYNNTPDTLTTISPSVSTGELSVASTTCGGSLFSQATCTVTLTYTAGSPAITENTLTVNFAGPEGASSFELPITLNTKAPASFSVTGGGATYNFNNVFDNANVSAAIDATYSVTFTNIGGVNATALSTAIPAAPFSSISDTCNGVTIAPGASCTVVLGVTITSKGTFSDTLSLNYHNGLTGMSAIKNMQGNGVRTGTVDPFYSVAPNWNDYVINDSPGSFFTDTNVGCAPSTDSSCSHGGELRKVVLPVEFSTCTGLTFSDSQSAFDWECDYSGQAIIRSKGLKRDKGLKDLLDPGAWKTMQLTVFDGANLAFQSTNLQWWSNPIFTINDMNATTTATSLPRILTSGVQGKSASNLTSGSLRTYDLNTTGGIYMTTTNISTVGVNISANKVALVTYSGTLSNTNSLSKNCGEFGNISGTLTNDRISLICTTADHVWIEGNFNGPNTSATVVLFMGASRFSRVHRANFALGATTVLVKGATKSNLFTDVSATRSGNFGIQIDGSTKQRFVGTRIAKNSGVGLSLTASANRNYFHDIRISNTMEGLSLNSSQDNVFTNLLVTSTASFAINTTSAPRTTILNGSFLNNATSGTTAAVKFTSGSGYNTVVNSVIANAGNTNPGLYITGGSNSKFDTLFLAHNPTNMKLNVATNSSFLNLYTGSAGTTDCNFTSAGSFTIDGNTPTDNQTYASCPYASGTTLNLSNSFLGKATSDIKNAHSSLIASGAGNVAFSSITTDWWSFQNPFRAWGRQNTNGGGADPIDTTAIGTCATGNCTLWDWRLDSADTELMDWQGQAFSAGSPCPGMVDGTSKTITNQMSSAPDTFLLYAFEEALDGVGDDDGLCESSEACIISQNAGAYQGEGTIQNSCTFSGSGVTGVTMRAFSSLFGL